MWFFIVTLMVIGAFFSGAFFALIVSKDRETDRKFIKGELKVITDALKNPSCPPPVPFPNETLVFKYIPGCPMPNPAEYFTTSCKINSDDDK